MTRQRFGELRNVAIVAHVDHGKTTLVDSMFQQAGVFRAGAQVAERAMDSLDLERERGITIMAKNTAVVYRDIKINIVDTPGHADFGGEVERILSMVDGVLLLVDAAEGPLPQTRFVLTKTLDLGLPVVVVINKVDRPDARPTEVLDEVYELFIDLGASDDQIEFPVLFASGRQGTASLVVDEAGESLQPLLDTILEAIPPPEGDRDGGLVMSVNHIDYDEYVGQLAIGRIVHGVIAAGQQVGLYKEDEQIVPGKVTVLYGFEGLTRVEMKAGRAGDIVAVAGLESPDIGDTITDPNEPRALPRITVEDPTLAMVFRVNDSPTAGRSGNQITSRVIRERLRRETLGNVAIRVEPTGDPAEFRVLGRGELQLAVLIEQMRREGYEICAGNPEIVAREIDGKKMEPVELLVVDVPSEFVGVVNEFLGPRKGRMMKMTDTGGRMRLEFRIPSRGLIGFRSDFLTRTKGTGLAHAILDGYEPWAGGISKREAGALVADRKGTTTAYAIEALEPRGIIFVGPGTEVYEGMVVGEHTRPNDLNVNIVREKKLTNIRSSTSDIQVRLTPPRIMSLEECIEWIRPDELVEVTPDAIRMRKRILPANRRSIKPPEME